MAVEAVSASEHNAVAFNWDKDAVQGERCEIWADNPADDTPMAFKKHALNDGEGVLFFDPEHSGTCNVEVRGENDSMDSGTLEVVGASSE